MSLATRCTSCGTVFRVVQDQLKVSEGWVRCGRCNEVFNALEGLFDLVRDTPPEWSPAVTGGATSSAAAASAPWSLGGLDAPPDPGLVDELDSRLFGSRRSNAASTPAKHVRERDRHEFSDAQFNPDWVAADETHASTGAAVLDFGVDPDSLEHPAPEFVRKAQRQARRRSPVASTLLSLVSLVLLLTLTLQAVHHFRDFVAARWPELKPALLIGCGVAGCSIEAPRRIENISVESTALARGTVTDSFHLSVTLRNRGTLTLALPSIELSLTDSSGQLLARRALSPRDFQVASAVLQPGAETALQLVLSAGTARVSGYTVEVFYP
jgi:predicted Zn finger-like uncharacterized protein